MIDFHLHSIRIEALIQSAYGIRIVTRDVPDPLTGDLDGAEIHIDYAVTSEVRLFLLVHLFGHTVQWNVSPKAFEIGRPHTPPVPEPLLAAIVDYEREAAGFGLALLHQAGIHDADQWLADFTASDMDYLAHYYRTGEKGDFARFRRTRAPAIEPRPIPPFTPAKRVFRLDGIVI